MLVGDLGFFYGGWGAAERQGPGLSWLGRTAVFGCSDGGRGLQEQGYFGHKNLDFREN